MALGAAGVAGVGAGTKVSATDGGAIVLFASVAAGGEAGCAAGAVGDANCGPSGDCAAAGVWAVENAAAGGSCGSEACCGGELGSGIAIGTNSFRCGGAADGSVISAGAGSRIGPAAGLAGAASSTIRGAEAVGGCGC
jgi:hypothetical protein